MAQAVEAPAQRTEVGESPKQAATYERRWLRPNMIVLYLVLILLMLFFVIPLLWMLSTAFKDEVAIYTDPGFIPKKPTFDNFSFVLTASGDTPVFRWLLNSLVVAAIGTVLTVVLTSMSAYAFARMDFRGKGFLFSFLSFLMELTPRFAESARRRRRSVACCDR